MNIFDMIDTADVIEVNFCPTTSFGVDDDNQLYAFPDTANEVYFERKELRNATWNGIGWSLPDRTRLRFYTLAPMHKNDA